MPSAWRHQVIGPRLRSQEQLLEIRSGHPFQLPPLLDRNEHGGFNSALGHNLWPFGEGGIE